MINHAASIELFRNVDSSLTNPSQKQIEAIGEALRADAREFLAVSSVKTFAHLYEFLDITSLNPGDTDQSIAKLCKEVRTIKGRNPDFSPATAVCVYPAFAMTALRELNNTGVRVAVVESAFPDGQSPIASRVADLKRLSEIGVHEIDIVIRRGLVLSGDFETLRSEIAQLREAAPNTFIKVILNTQQLGITGEDPSLRYQRIRDASMVCIKEGMNMLKTSTGKDGQIAQLDDSIVMMRAIIDSGTRCGFKVAGGIKTPEEALTYLLLTEIAHGAEVEITPFLFRIGASGLAKTLETGSTSAPPAGY